MGHKVELLAPRIKNSLETEVNDIYEYYNVRNCFEIKRLFHPKAFLFGPLLYLILILVMINRSKPNIVYSRYIGGTFLAIICGYKTIFESHYPIAYQKRIYKKVFDYCIKNPSFKRLIVITQPLKDIYSISTSINEKKILVAPDGADENMNSIKLRNWIGRKDTLQVGYVGHLYKGKGMEIIISLACLVDDIDFHIIGGFEKDIEYWKIKSKSSNIYFHGFINQCDISKYYQMLDIVLLPNQRHVSPFNNNLKHPNVNISKFTSPLKMFEYMAAQKPIISSDIKVLREVLNSKNAILVPPDNINSWVNALNLLRNKNLRKKLSTTAYNDYLNNYTWDKRASNILKGC
jgi:glycosyltransferase involved in cell wall biosynthesis